MQAHREPKVRHRCDNLAYYVALSPYELENQMMKTTTAIRPLTLVVLATLSMPALASYPDITGTWSGAITGNDFSCSNPIDNGPFSETLDIVFSNQDPASGTFDFVLTGVEDDGEVTTESGSGAFSSTNSIQFTLTEADGSGTDTTTVNATGLDTGTASLNFSGSNLGTDNCYWTGNGTVTRASIGSIVNPAAAPSNAVTSSAATLTQVVTVTTSALASRVQSALNGSRGGPRRVAQGFMMETPTGMAAGETFNNIGMWGSYAYSSFENDFSRTKYDGRRYMFFGGVDFAPQDNMVLGVSVGYEDTDIDTDFNLGKLNSDGWTIAPYFGMILNDTWNADISAGYSAVDTDQQRSLGAITSKVDTTRWFASGNINGFTQVNNWLLTARAGLLRAESKDDGFTEVGAGGLTVGSSETKLTQFNIGAEVAYAMGNFEPYFSASYHNDLSATKTVLTAGAQPSNDKDDFLLGVGFRYFNDDNLSISAQWDTRLGRADIDESSFNVNARWNF
jgi:hypothetical protein